jgi:glycosyltransferase involved in cell wall biosynthesis
VRIGAAPAEHIQFVPNGVDLRRFRPDEDERDRIRQELAVNDRFVWLAVGRPSAAKNYPNMIDAFSRLSDLNTVLLIVGRGDMDDQLRQRASDPGLFGRVRPLGARPDVPALMNAADGYVLSSDWEGMPLVLQEASCTGLPIVATDVGGNREVVADGQTGLIVPPRNASALAAAMRRVMSMTPEQRRHMGFAARQRMAEVFDLEKVLDQWEDIYHELSSRRMPVASDP